MWATSARRAHPGEPEDGDQLAMWAVDDVDLNDLVVSPQGYKTASWLARREFTWPPVDLIPVLAGAVVISYWCYAEAHR